MTESQGDQLIQLQQQQYQYVQDMQVMASQSLAYSAALHQGLLLLAGFVIILGIILITQGRPRGSH